MTYKLFKRFKLLLLAIPALCASVVALTNNKKTEVKAWADPYGIIINDEEKIEGEDYGFFGALKSAVSDHQFNEGDKVIIYNAKTDEPDLSFELDTNSSPSVIQEGTAFYFTKTGNYNILIYDNMMGIKTVYFERIIEYVCSIVYAKYESLEDAVNNCVMGDTITLLKDCDEVFEVSRNINFILDIANHSFTGRMDPCIESGFHCIKKTNGNITKCYFSNYTIINSQDEHTNATVNKYFWYWGTIHYSVHLDESYIIIYINELYDETNVKYSYANIDDNYELTGFELSIGGCEPFKIYDEFSIAPTKLSGSIVVFPIARKIQVTVSFDTQGHGNEVYPKTVNNGATITKPEDPTAEGYEFDGWYLDNEFRNPFDFTTPITDDITLYAKWNAEVVPEAYVTFDTQGKGDLVSPQTIQVGNLVTKPTDPVATGYVFKGWFTEPACENEWNFEVDKPIADMTLYAKWEEAEPAPMPTPTPEEPAAPEEEKKPSIWFLVILGGVGLLLVGILTAVTVSNSKKKAKKQ